VRRERRRVDPLAVHCVAGSGTVVAGSGKLPS
jgi:hypothetical protein